MNKAAMYRGSSVGLVLTWAIAAPVWAHHSAAGYDMKTLNTAEATIKEFRWGAPHSAAVFIVRKDGKVQEMSMNSATPAMFNRQGFKPKDFKVGDKVEITWNPSKSGKPGGFLSSMKLQDGRTFNDVELTQLIKLDQGALSPNAEALAPNAAPPRAP